MKTFLAVAPVTIVLAIAVVTWGGGGYAPWAMLALELSAIALAAWLVAAIVFSTSQSDRERSAAMSRAQRGSLLKGLKGLKGWTGRTATIEILEPSSDADGETLNPIGGRYHDAVYVLGYGFRRVGSGIVLVMLTAWIALSLTPLPSSWLSILSPRALQLKTEALSLSSAGGEITAFAWSLVPFLSYQDLLLWLAYLMLFWVSYHVADSSRAARRLSIGLVVLGIASGIHGLFQWLARLASNSEGTVAGNFLATGAFGNRNHYAMFQEMLLLVSLGWLLMRYREGMHHARDNTSAQEAKARTMLLGLGVGVIALSLLFSLSRSGVTFAMIGCALFFFATWSRGESRRLLAAGAIVLLASALWIGIHPLLSRFEAVDIELTNEQQGRALVWRDSLDTVSDFWLTGSGMSSFQYVFPAYRSFGGRRFFSWAHNDYLQLAVELGLPGLFLCALLLFWIIGRAVQVRRNLTHQTRLRDLHAGYCGATLAVSLHSFTDFGLHLPANAALFAVILGVVTGLSPSRRSAKSAKAKGRRKLRRSPPMA